MRKLVICKIDDDVFTLHFVDGEKMVSTPPLNREAWEHVLTFIREDIPVEKAKAKSQPTDSKPA